MRPRGGRREGAGRPKAPLLPFRAALVELPRAVPVGSIEELLVRQATRHVWREKPSFAAFLDAHVDGPDSPARDLALDARAFADWDGSIQALRNAICPSGVDVREPGDPCPTTDAQPLERVLSQVVEEYEAAVGAQV